MLLSSDVLTAAPLSSPSFTDLLSSVSGELNVAKTALEIISLVSIVIAVVLFPRLHVWYESRKKLLDKQAAAYQNYYPKLKSMVSELRAYLIEEGQLEIDDVAKGNIFALRYVENYLQNNCPNYQPPILDDSGKLKRTVREVENLLKSNENIFPRKAEADDWQRQMRILESFCQFILNLDCEETTNPKSPTHIEEAKELEEALNYILSTI